jgi:hypothetical protein
MADIEDAEPAETIDVFFAVDVAIRIGARIRPFHDGCGAIRRSGFAIFQEAGIDVIAKRLDRFARNPSGILRRDVRLGDEF